MRQHFAFGVAAAASLFITASAASAATIWEDQFNRPNSGTVGNGWSEIENGNGDASINSNHLRIRDTVGGLPDAAAASQVIDATGFDTITVTFRWRPLDNNESNDRLHLAWALDPAPAMSNEGAWNDVFNEGRGNTAWAVDTVSISPGADNGMFNLMFWTNVTDNGNGNTEGFRIDYVQVMGEPIQSVSVVPLPASLPLLAAGLFGLGALRRRRGASA